MNAAVIVTMVILRIFVFMGLRLRVNESNNSLRLGFYKPKALRISGVSSMYSAITTPVGVQ